MLPPSFNQRKRGHFRALPRDDQHGENNGPAQKREPATLGWGDGDGFACLAPFNVFSLSLWERGPIEHITAPLYSPNSSRLTRCSGGPVIQLRLNLGGFRQLVLLIQSFIAFTPCISLNSASWRIGTSCRSLEARNGPSPVFQHRFLFRRFSVVHKEVVDLVFWWFRRDSCARRSDRPGSAATSRSPSSSFQLLWRGGFQLVEVFGVVGGNIHLLVGDGQRVSFMPSVDGALKVAGGDIVFGKRRSNRGRGSQRWS